MWEKKGMTEDEMVEWHHQLDGQGFGWTGELFMDSEAWPAAYIESQRVGQD